MYMPKSNGEFPDRKIMMINKKWYKHVWRIDFYEQ